MNGVPLGKWRDVPKPSGIAALKTDPRGFPIPYVAHRWDHLLIPPPSHPHYGMLAVPDKAGGRRLLLGVMDEERQRHCWDESVCQVCGGEIPEDHDHWLAGGVADNPLDRFLFREPYVCRRCMVYAVRVCPGLVAGVHRGGLRVVRAAEVEMHQERVGASDQKPIVVPATTPWQMLPPSALFYMRGRVVEGDVFTVPEFLEEYG